MAVTAVSELRIVPTPIFPTLPHFLQRLVNSILDERLEKKFKKKSDLFDRRLSILVYKLLEMVPNRENIDQHKRLRTAIENAGVFSPRNDALELAFTSSNDVIAPLVIAHTETARFSNQHLRQAMNLNKPLLVQEILKKNHPDRDLMKKNVVLWASYHGYLSLVQEYNFGYIKNIDGLTPLHIASSRGHDDIVSFLVNDENINKWSYTGFTPLACACLEGRLSTVRLLIARGPI